MAGDPPSGSDPTLDDTLSAGEPRSGEIATSARAVAYKLGSVLGKGGMGEVWAADDERLGREVALKRMRTTAPTKDELQRFLREAKIQARLDHPAIVPVYELGTDAEGFPYFTMKKLVGTTLAQRIAAGDPMTRLLRALADVCLAIARAHTKGIVHRDLKPSNIMMGDYGEVYVIDWGIARIIGDAEDARTEAMRLSSSSHTRTGQLLGTPGYMSPEQIRGQLVEGAADVYALGSILFEIVAGEPLHPRGGAALGSTLETPVVAPSARAPKRAVPLELDELCVQALAEQPAARPSARELGERIQQYLDGDRDTERRRVLAAQLVVEGRAALERGERAEAVRLGGRAIALDQENEEAAGLVVSLVTTPPEKLPDEVEQRLLAHEHDAVRARSRRALAPMLGFYLLTPFLTVIHVVNWAPLLAVYAAVTMLAVLAYVNWRVRSAPLPLWLAANVIACAVFTRLTGPFILTPVLICAIMMSASAQPWLVERRWALFATVVVAVVTPFVLEYTGVFASSWTMTVDGVVSMGTIFDHSPSNAYPVFFSNLAIVAVVAGYSRAIARDRRLAQRQLIVQSWHLQQLLPRRPVERM